MLNIFNEDFFLKHNYVMTVNEKDPNYVEALSKHVWDYDKNACSSVKDKRKIMMNRENGWLTIKDDWDTRTVFNGQVSSAEELSVILKCVR